MGQAKDELTRQQEIEEQAFRASSHPCMRCGEPAAEEEMFCDYCNHVHAKTLAS